MLVRHVEHATQVWSGVEEWWSVLRPSDRLHLCAPMLGARDVLLGVARAHPETRLGRAGYHGRVMRSLWYRVEANTVSDEGAPAMRAAHQPVHPHQVPSVRAVWDALASTTAVVVVVWLPMLAALGVPDGEVLRVGDRLRALEYVEDVLGEAIRYGAVVYVYDYEGLDPVVPAEGESHDAFAERVMADGAIL